MHPLLGYPARRVLAVFDTSEAADAATTRLRDLGIPDTDIERLSGIADADRLDGTGSRLK
jgi:hypothetical protein